MRLILLGLPGAGKGTQGERISEKYGIPHISTGSLIRSVIASGSELGNIVNEYISQGNLIPDEYMIAILRHRIFSSDDCKYGWILDGYPRTVAQALHLDSMLKQDSMEIDSAFDIRISCKEAVLRIVKRRVCRSCNQVYSLVHEQTEVESVCSKCGSELYQRSDDNYEVAMHRLEVYMDQTHPLVHYYANLGKLVSINGEQDIDLVFDAVDKEISELVRENRTGEVQ